MLSKFANGNMESLTVFFVFFSLFFIFAFLGEAQDWKFKCVSTYAHSAWSSLTTQTPLFWHNFWLSYRKQGESIGTTGKQDGLEFLAPLLWKNHLSIYKVIQNLMEFRLRFGCRMNFASAVFGNIFHSILCSIEGVPSGFCVFTNGVFENKVVVFTPTFTFVWSI